MARRKANKPTAAQVQYREVYLRSDHWRAAAAAARKRAGYRCQDCGAAKPLDVHHLTYERIGAEADDDLRALCRGCHDKAHGLKAKPHRKKVTKRRAAEPPAALGRIVGPRVSARERERAKAEAQLRQQAERDRRAALKRGAAEGARAAQRARDEAARKAKRTKRRTATLMIRKIPP